MSKFHTTRLVQHDSTEMFNLVADVENYPNFLPMCEALDVTSRHEEDGKTFITADMTVAYKGFRETFTSNVTLDKDNRRIEVQYVDGPFKHLENYWTFTPAGDKACNVEFFIEYEFKNKLLTLALGSIFNKVFKNFSEVFEERADELYGQNN